MARGPGDGLDRRSACSGRSHQKSETKGRLAFVGQWLCFRWRLTGCLFLVNLGQQFFLCLGGGGLAFLDRLLDLALQPLCPLFGLGLQFLRASTLISSARSLISIPLSRIMIRVSSPDCGARRRAAAAPTRAPTTNPAIKSTPLVLSPICYGSFLSIIRRRMAFSRQDASCSASLGRARLNPGRKLSATDPCGRSSQPGS
jgi:hypothetical protein